MWPSASRTRPVGSRASSDGTTRIVSTGCAASLRSAKSSARNESTSAQCASSMTTATGPACRTGSTPRGSAGPPRSVPRPALPARCAPVAQRPGRRRPKRAGRRGCRRRWPRPRRHCLGPPSRRGDGGGTRGPVRSSRFPAHPVSGRGGRRRRSPVRAARPGRRARAPARRTSSSRTIAGRRRGGVVTYGDSETVSSAGRTTRRSGCPYRGTAHAVPDRRRSEDALSLRVGLRRRTGFPLNGIRTDRRTVDTPVTTGRTWVDRRGEGRMVALAWPRPDRSEVDVTVERAVASPTLIERPPRPLAGLRRVLGTWGRSTPRTA